MSKSVWPGHSRQSHNGTHNDEPTSTWRVIRKIGSEDRSRSRRSAMNNGRSEISSITFGFSLVETSTRVVKEMKRCASRLLLKP